MEKAELFVSGRLCLFGEHSDWAGTNRIFDSKIVPGRAIVTGIEQGIHATAEKADAFSVDYLNAQEGERPFCCEMDADKLRDVARQGGFHAYVAGVASYMCETYAVGGVKITIIRRDLPMKKGLSSSAAICVLVARAFNDLYALHLNTEDIMEIAYLGERRTPSRCGRLDQACAFGVAPVEMVFDGDKISCRRISVGKPLHFVFADLNAKKDTVKILSALNGAYPFPRNESEEKLHELLGKDNWDMTACAVQDIEAGNAEHLGRLMTQAQRLFDEKAMPLCPKELSAPMLHSILADEKVQRLTYGGKGVGSQGDGAVQFLAKDQRAQEELTNYLSLVGFSPYQLTLQSDRVVRKAVIPVAGFGTRMYPATRFIKKEFLPLRDQDGMVKPALLILLEELDAAGIEKICLIIHPSDREQYKKWLLPIGEEHFLKLPPSMQAYERRLSKIWQKVELVEQNEPKGFGHAVYQAAEFADGEPVLLMLGDTVYKSNGIESCTQQLMKAFAALGKTTVALADIPPEESERYGVLSGEWEDSRQSIMRCTHIAEKPTPEYAKASLMMQRRDEETLYGVFGAYVLTEEIFERLGDAIQNGLVSKRGEIELTDALAWVAENGTVMGAVLDGRSFDLGNPSAYQKAMAEFER